MGPLRPDAVATIRAFLRCGDLAAGFTRFHCPDCGHEKLLAFTCKSRHFCPACHQRRVRQTGGWIAASVCHEFPHRQFVFTFPKMLRGIFRKRRHLLHLLLQTATESLRDAFRARLDLPGGLIAAAAAVHTFGDYLVFHPHLHIFAADGLIDEAGRFHAMPDEALTPITELFRHRILQILRDGKHLSAQKVTDLLSWKHSGFHIDGGEKPVAPGDAKGRQRLAEYLLRAPFSLQKIHWNPRIKTVIYRSRRSWRTKRNFEVFKATDFLAAAIDHTPPRSQQTIRSDALEAAVDFSIRYLHDFRLPDKAIDLVDQACAMAMLRSFSKAAGNAQSKRGAIGKGDIAAAVAERCKIPVARLADDERERLLHIEATLETRVKGQSQAVSAVADAVRMARSGMKDPNKPTAVLLFAGPTGTGKTELAKALMEFLFGSESSLLHFDMSEYMEEHSVSKLIGAPPGYVGHDEGGKLTDAVRAKPYSVILFDEVEKAHPRVLDLFLQVFDEGTLADSRGRKASFREAVIILTSNLGSGAVAKKKMGFGAGLAGEDASGDLHSRIAEAIKRHLRPELLNRISRTVVFNPLSPEHVREIVEKFIARLNTRLGEQGLNLTLDESVYALLIKEGYRPEFGARPMERAIEALIAQPLAKTILEGRAKEGREILARASGAKVTFEFA